YDAWSPRLSFIYDLTGNGKVALKASYGRYAAAGSGVNDASGPVANSVNPATARTNTYRWTRAIPYTPNGADLQSVSGGRGDRRLDPGLDAQGMDEYTGGVDLGLSKDFTVPPDGVRQLGLGAPKH